MASITVWRRLHGVFSKSRPSTPISISAIPTPAVCDPSNEPSSTEPPHITRKNCLKEIILESEPSVIAEKFRQLSRLSWFRRNRGIYLYTVRSLSFAKKFHLIDEIIEDQKKYSNITDEGFVVRLINLYGLARMPDEAHKLFDEMPALNCNRTVLSFNALIAAFLPSERFDRVLELFRVLPPILSIMPDVVSYNTLITTYCLMGSLDTALGVLDLMEKHGIFPDKITFNKLLDGFYGAGKFSRGEELWVLMESKGVEPCVMSYNAKIHGLVVERRFSDAVELFDSLKTKGLEANLLSYNILLKGFCDEHNVDEARRWYRALYASDCKPNKMTYATLVPFMFEKGHSEFAHELCVDAASLGCRFGSVEKQILVEGTVCSLKDEDLKFSEVPGLGD